MSAGIGAADAAIYTGICVENHDPLGQGRIKYCVPQLSGTAAFGWASGVSPGYAAVGSAVYIAFEGGDRNRPLFWPDQVAMPTPPSYPTYAALTAAHPATTTPAGSTFYVVDHGGNVQLQNTGATSPSVGWQWLPNGYQADQNGGGQVYGGFRANSYLLNSVNFYNPSLKRKYRATAEASFFCTAGPVGVGIGILFGTATPPSTIVSTTTWDIQNSAYMPTVDSTALIRTPVNVSGVKSSVPVGFVYCASYLLYISTDDVANIFTYPAGGGNGYRNLVVEDIGAVT